LKATKLVRVFRATRMLRVLRTLKFFNRLQRYTVTIFKSLKSLGAILSLTGSLIAIFAAIACAIFGHLLPKRFGNMFLTIFTLLQLITLDDWYEIIQEGSVTQESETINGPLMSFIIAYIFLMVFIVFNLLLAVLVDNFQVSEEENRAKVSHQKAQTSSALAQLEAVESDDNSDDEAVLDHIFDGESKPAKTGDLDDEEEFAEHFGDMPPSQLLILQWYYRILPAVEKQMFHYNDQMSSYERIIEEAISQSDNVM